MKVTVFKNIFVKHDPMYLDVISVFRRIKDGKSKDLIDIIRDSKDKEERNKHKKKLPSICFSGEFSQRGEKYLLKHSGLICLDIDDIVPDDMGKIRTVLEADDFTMGLFVSPSGNGFKLIIKVAPDKTEHKGMFLALERHFNAQLGRYKLDKSGKDVSRVCYESYDPHIYQNPDSDIWGETLKEEVVQKPVEEQTKIIELLHKWIDKNETYTEGNRNNYLSKFLYALCRYGIDEYTAKGYLLGQFQGLPQRDLDSIAKSCYSKGDFGTAQFEESDYRKTASTVKVETNESISEFWNINDKGRVKIDTKRYLEFVEGKGFGIYRHKDSVKTWEFVRTYNMIVDVVDTIDIKKLVLEHVQKYAPEPVFDEMQMRNRYFEKSFLNALPLIHVEQVRDTPDKCFIFFEDYYYEITKKGKELKSYVDLKDEGIHIWRAQICKKSITELRDYSKFDFNKFIWNAMGKSQQKYESLCTTIGYAIHSFKKQRLTKLVYMCDNSIGELDGLAMGGSGKNLIQKLFEYCRAVVYIDGKELDKRDKFKFQNVNMDTQLVIIDDYEGDIKEMFTKITGHFGVEKKGLDKVNLSFEESPKMMITSNSAPKGYSDSFARRLQLLELSNHYNNNHTPEDEFGNKDFFSNDWTQEEWDMLYSFIFDCIKLYLDKGLLKVESSDLKTKQFIKNCGRNFAEYWQYTCDKDMSEFEYARPLIDHYKEEMADHETTEQAFYGKMRKMCGLYGWQYVSVGTGANRKVRFVGFKTLKKE